MSNPIRNYEALLRLPKAKLGAYKNSFKFMGAKVFNELPLDIRINVFKENFLSLLKNHFND